MPLFDLKKHLVFYGAYHREPTNVKIHITFVPILLATGFFFGTNTPSIRGLPSTILKPLLRLNLQPNLCTIAATTYATSYLLLSPNFAGATVSPLILLTASLANRLSDAAIAKGEKAKLNAVAVGVHIFSWIIQFIGHGKFEGRKPALLDNLIQALGLAPLFVWYEVLFKLGFYKKLQAEVETGSDAEIRRIKAEEAAKAN